MMSFNTLVLVSLLYIAFLFAIAFRAERRAAGFGPVEEVEEPADPEVDDDPDEDGPEHQESGALAGRS